MADHLIVVLARSRARRVGKIEVSTSRFADRLESRLEEERRGREDEVGNLQRQIGTQGAAILLLRERERGRSSWLSRLLGG